jgi:hypothetical protein
MKGTSFPAPETARALLGAAALLFALAAAAHAQEAGTLRIAQDQWRYHAGNDPRCAAVDNAGCTLQPAPREAFAGDRFYWKRVEITLPDELRKTSQLGLLAADRTHTYEAYVNGQAIGGTANFGFYGASVNGSEYLTFPASLAPDSHLVIAIRFFPQWRARSLNTSLPYVLAAADRMRTVADAEALRNLRFNATHYLCFAAVGLAGFVFLLLYSVNPRLWENLWLGISFVAVASLRVVEIAPIVRLWMPVWVEISIYEFANCLTPLFLIEFVFSFLKRPVPWYLRLVQILALGDLYFVLQLPLPPALDWFAIHGTPTAVLFATLTQLLMLPECFRSKLPEMRWIGASVLFITVENGSRMTQQLGIPSLPQDMLWHGYDIDIRGISYMLFASVMLIAMTFRLRRIQNRNREVEQEMAAARSVQQILIPDQLPQVPGLAIESAYLPAQDVGGDFFQILLIPAAENPDQPSAFIVLGDVSGKGLKAAMTVSLIVGTLRTSARHCNSPADLLSEVNRSLVGRCDGFATCLALMVEHSGKITVANAGHPNPYLNGVEIATESNLPLGVDAGVHYSEVTIQFPSDQICTLVTDGVVEATSATSRELFGFDRTQSISTQPASSIAKAASAFGQGAPQADDITVLTIARTPVALPALA